MMSSAGLESIYRKNPDVVYRVIAGEAILIPISRETQAAGRMLTLNETGAFIWERLDGKRQLAEIAEEIRKEYDVGEESARDDLRDLIENLERMGAVTLLSADDEAAPPNGSRIPGHHS